MKKFGSLCLMIFIFTTLSACGPSTRTESATLYFADEQATCLLPEVREFQFDSQDALGLPRAVLSGLIQGPAGAGETTTLPEGTEVLGLELKAGTLAVNFSPELKSNHYGGSAGEILTIYSIVNSLTSLPDIEQVQILLEGEPVETLAGHVEITDPLKFNERILLNGADQYQ
jgi:spore germination protein GerM